MFTKFQPLHDSGDWNIQPPKLLNLNWFQNKPPLLPTIISFQQQV